MCTKFLIVLAYIALNYLCIG